MKVGDVYEYRGELVTMRSVGEKSVRYFTGKYEVTTNRKRFEQEAKARAILAKHQKGEM